MTEPSMDTFDNIVDRSGWPSGEWDKEPDRATWVHEATGARCTMRRHSLGHWCGYVGLGPNHPLAGKDYNHVDVQTVHGGLTYAAYCHPMAEDEWIRYRLRREKWLTESLVYPQGDAARMLAEDRKGDTSTLIGFLEWIRRHNLCHDDCPHGLWWLGFDCAQAWDVVPVLLQHYRERHITFDLPGHPMTYKNFEYVVGETNALAVELYDERLLKGDT